MEDRGTMAESSLAFKASLYSSKIPRTVEEALRSKEWKQAMEEEIGALMKIEHGKDVLFRKGRKS